MRYVRFLKTPRIVQDEKKPSAQHVSCLITITSDLGDSFLPHDLTLSAELIDGTSTTEEVIVWKTIQWTQGMRSLPVTLPLSSSYKGKGPLIVRIGTDPKSKYDVFGRLREADTRGVVSAWSAPFSPAEGEKEAAKLVQRRFNVFAHTPDKSVEHLKNIMSIFEETGESIAHHVWDAGVALSCWVQDLFTDDYFSHAWEKQISMRDPIKNWRAQILELGSGCGILGVTLARIDLHLQDVILTDVPEARELIEHNLKTTKIRKHCTVRFQELDWEQDIPDDFFKRYKLRYKQLDIIFASDCCYNSDRIPSLVKTLRQLAYLSPGVTVAIATKKRHPSEDIFFTLMSEAKFEISGELDIELPGDEKANEECVQMYWFLYNGPSGPEPSSEEEEEEEEEQEEVPRKRKIKLKKEDDDAGE